MTTGQRPIGFSIRLFLPGGDPDGLKIVEKSNWIGCGLVFPRALFGVARTRPELQRTGIYVLVGPDPQSERERVYIGQGDPIRPRLDLHFRNRDFWTRAIAFVSRGENLNRAHVQLLESRLIERAKAAKRCVLENATAPAAPSLSEADTAEVHSFLADMLLCLPVLGYGFFETPPPIDPTTREFVVGAGGLTARGYEASTGFVVRSGSQAAKVEAASIPDYLRDLRSTLAARGVLGDRGAWYELTEDYVFASPSTAAGVMLGRSANGRVEWKTSEGQTLRAIQNAEVTP
jgi:hypothetical protein